MERGPSARRPYLALAALAAAASGSLAVPALAGDTGLGSANGISYVTDAQAITPGQPSAPSVECPPGTHLLGAGGDSVSTQLGGILAGLRPEDSFADGNLRPDDGATAFGFNTTGATANTVVWAFCGPVKMRYPSRSRTMDIGVSRATKVKCPKRTKAVSGGFSIEGSNGHVHMNISRPFDGGDDNSRPEDGWQVKATNLGGFDEKDFTVWAFCAMGIQVKYPDLDNLGGAGGNAAGGVGQGCPDQARSVAGAGGEIRGRPDSRRLTAIMPSDNSSSGEPDSVPDDVVFVEVQNDAATQARIGAHPICAALGP